MTQLRRILAVGIVSLSLVTVSHAGTITGSKVAAGGARAGTITGSRAGTITGSRAGTITGSRAGTITGSRAGTITGSRIATGSAFGDIQDEFVARLITLLVYGW